MKKEIRQIAIASLVFNILAVIAYTIGIITVVASAFIGTTKGSATIELLTLNLKTMLSWISIFSVVILVLNILLAIKMHRIGAQALLILGIFFFIPSFFILPKIISGNELIRLSAVKAEEEMQKTLEDIWTQTESVKQTEDQENVETQEELEINKPVVSEINDDNIDKN
ncbi:Uncharacterised protein [Metamycoplasma cloacale]|uniref:Uncharacterized protein n=1 Tax=Metamycoplasma cloacale TaxID=92401 RepID=A0A2Z4LMM2_9BACT|nr:hypothetical protein [Metamycoplasma cloacale]AWX42678.1 hypothetical protein DK849_01135 [Metamycoplasma cloacale]VEU79510.1 Uncharacterised protein [Metamycoplasma cloacale]